MNSTWQKSGERSRRDVLFPLFLLKRKQKKYDGRSAGAGTILMVDDDENVLSIGIEIIRSIGFEAVGADGG